MKKTIFLCVIVSLLFSPLLAAEQSIVLKVKVQVANVRAEPDINSTVVKKVSIDTLLEARQRIGDWYEISVTDSAGAVVSAYIHSQVVDVIAGDPDVEEPVREEPVREPVRDEPRPPIDRRPSPVRYGPDYGPGGFKVLGGLAMASLSYPTEETAELDKYKKSRMGLAGGIGFDTGGQFALSFNLLYMQKGVKFAGQDDDGTVKFNAPINIDQLSVPLMAKMRFMPGSTPYLVAGGEVAFILSANAGFKVTDLETGEVLEEGSEDIKEDLKSLDYGLVFGLGYEINTGSIPFFLEIRYHLGLADILNPEENGNGNGEDLNGNNWLKTSAIVFSDGIKF